MVANNDELTDDAKSRIRAEEIYRSEVQRELHGRKSRWHVLNQPFTLWFLSSVVLAAGAWSYNRIQANYDANLKQQDRAKKIKIELQYRFRSFYALHVYEHTLCGHDREWIERIDDFEVFKSEVENLLGVQRGLLSEFGQRTSIALLWEMATLDPDSAWDVVLNAALELQRIVNLNPMIHADETNCDRIKAHVTILKRIQELWGDAPRVQKTGED